MSPSLNSCQYYILPESSCPEEVEGVISLFCFFSAYAKVSPEEGYLDALEISQEDIEKYLIQANSKHAKLLPVDERTIGNLRRKGGVGQSQIWHGDHKSGKSIALEVLELSSEKGGKRKGRKRKTTDLEHNAEVEKAL